MEVLLQNPNTHAGRELSTSCHQTPVAITCCFGEPERQAETSLQGRKVVLPVNAGHFLSLPSCLEVTRGLDEHSESLATLSPWKTEWQAQSLLKGAGWGPGLSVNAPQLNWIQLWLWNLILTNVFLGQPVFPTAGSLRPPHRSPDGRFGGALG